MNYPIPRMPDDEVDRLLSAFFRAEMPDPWPEAPEHQSTLADVQPVTVAAAPGVTLNPSRFSLAVSVALLIGTCWCLSRIPVTNTAPPRETGLLNGSTATMPMEMAPMVPMNDLLPTMLP